MTHPPIVFRVPPGTTEAPGTTPAAHWRTSQSAGPRTHKGIVILPITGGDYDVAVLFAEYFSQKGYQTLQLERRTEWLVVDRPLSALGPLFAAYVDDINRAIDAWRLEAGLDAVGIFGVSMGAIVGSRVLSQRDDISASVLCIGGGPLSEIVARSHDPDTKRFREGLRTKLGLTDVEVRRRLAEVLAPLESSHPLSPQAGDHTLFITALLDRVVPLPLAIKLWKAIGRPTRRFLPTGHYSAALALPWIKRASLRWFDRHL